MTTRLVDYGSVAPGFELLIENKEARAWGSWWNVKLTDDPDAWDAEIVALNAMQQALGELAPEQRLIRAHVAEFCRYHPTFPGSVALLCREIGSGRLVESGALGCEGRGLLAALGCRDADSSASQHREVHQRYARALEGWLAGDRSEEAVQAKVAAFLGARTEDKEAFTSELVAALTSECPSRAALKALCEQRCLAARDEALLDPPCPKPFGCFRCEGVAWLAPRPECGCAEAMILDASLLCTGDAGDRGSMVKEARRFVEEYILAYALAINAWLEGAALEVTWPDHAHFLSAPGAQKIATEVHAVLGNGSPAKGWLAGCLLKTVSGNQRWHAGTELLDGFPQATSWLRRG